MLEEQECVTSLGFTSYYKKEFFQTIKKCTATPLYTWCTATPLVHKTVGQWYQYLVTETVTMEEESSDFQMTFRYSLGQFFPDNHCRLTVITSVEDTYNETQILAILNY